MDITWQYVGSRFDTGEDVKTYKAWHDNKLTCTISGPDIGLNNPSEEWHLAISHPHREPTPEEIRSAINEHIPADVPMRYLKDAVLKTIGKRKPALHFHQDTGENNFGEPFTRTVSTTPGETQ